jgi:hypothetical protein
MTDTRHPSGRYFELIEPTAQKLREYFKAGIPVTASGDGYTYRAERPLPTDAVQPDQEACEGE